jgi:ParB family chromosome partitioning protein
VENCASEAVFDEKRRAVLALLGFDPETPTVTGGYDGKHGLAGLLVRLIELPDPAVLDILAIVMAETLEAGSGLIELLGLLVGTGMAKVWQADDVLLDLIKDREVLGHVLADVAGAQVATANEAETGKVKRRIIRDCLTGENGRAMVEGWMPKWMAFPPADYTERGGVGTVSRAARLADLTMPAAPQPEPLRQAA